MVELVGLVLYALQYLHFPLECRHHRAQGCLKEGEMGKQKGVREGGCTQVGGCVKGEDGEAEGGEGRWLHLSRRLCTLAVYVGGA